MRQTTPEGGEAEYFLLRQRVSQLELCLAQRERQIQAIYASRSWRMTAAVRRLTSALRRWLSRQPDDIPGMTILPDIGDPAVEAAATPPVQAPVPAPVWPPKSVSYRFERTASFDEADHLLLFVAYCPHGRLSELQECAIEAYHGMGYKVVLVVNSGNMRHLGAPGGRQAAMILVRDNVGYDFGAWRHACRLLGGLDRAASVSFTNDSLVGPMPQWGGSDLRRRIDAVAADIVFLTSNHQVRDHFQSFFFTVKAAALRGQALNILRDIPYYDSKHALIHEQELYLSDRFRDTGFSVGGVFHYDAADAMDKNPTIDGWKGLLAQGFPFFKMQNITAGIMTADNPDLLDALGETFLRLMQAHLREREEKCPPPCPDRNLPPQPALPTLALFGPHGALQAYNPPSAQIPVVAVPLQGVSDIASAPRILAVVHCFYLDIAEDLLRRLGGLGVAMRLLLTTDSEAKADVLRQMLPATGLSARIVVTPNRGRDVGPLLIEGAKHLGDADLVLHLHTKKSVHDQIYSGWGSYLCDNLIGSPDIVRSILRLLAEPEVGVVYAAHFPAVRGLRNWGYDFDDAKGLMARLGLAIRADGLLEFPTSTMLWAKVDALRPLFDLNLTYDDFPVEQGLVDGTLAHAIERCILLVAETRGYRGVPVAGPDYQDSENAVSLSFSDIASFLRIGVPRLQGAASTRSFFYQDVGELFPVSVARSSSAAGRLTVAIPTLKPEKVFGGISTALRVVGNLLAEMPPQTRLRLLVTSDDVDAASMQEVCRRLGRSFVLAEPDDDGLAPVVVDLVTRRHLPISLCAGDVFFATAWWTADLAFRLRDQQAAMFGGVGKLLYFIQDYEPGFYPWGNQYVLAQATYARPDDTIALINSEELANYLAERTDFRDSFQLPFAIDTVIAGRLVPTVKQQRIIIYGRPSVARNLFSIIVEGLRLWQARDPKANCRFQLIFAGEAFDPLRLAELENAQMLGKLSLEDYATTLNQSAIGISLMVSPHPSYPPLEMAAAGCITITNGYDGKDLTRRAANILSLEAIDPEALADALEVAVSRVVWDAPTLPVPLAGIPTPVAVADYRRMAALLAAQWQQGIAGFAAT